MMTWVIPKLVPKVARQLLLPIDVPRPDWIPMTTRPTTTASIRSHGDAVARGSKTTMRHGMRERRPVLRAMADSSACVRRGVDGTAHQQADPTAVERLPLELADGPTTVEDDDPIADL